MLREGRYKTLTESEDEVSGTVYLAFMAIDENLSKIKIDQDKLPTSVEGYRKALTP